MDAFISSIIEKLNLQQTSINKLLTRKTPTHNLITEGAVSGNVLTFDGYNWVASASSSSSAVPANTTNAIAANAADIATNTANIATNTADIATNTADIANIATNAANIAREYAAGALASNVTLPNITWTTVTFTNNISLFPNNWNATPNGQYTVENNGIFLVTANLVVESDTSQLFTTRLRIYQGNAIRAGGAASNPYPDDVRTCTLNRQTIMNCAQGDTIHVDVYAHASGSTYAKQTEMSGTACELTILQIA